MEMQHHCMQHGCPFSNVLILWFLQPCPLVDNIGRRFDDFVFIVCMVSPFSLSPCKYHLGQPCGTVSPVETSYKIQISYYLKDSGAQLTPRTKLILHTYLGMAHPKNVELILLLHKHKNWIWSHPAIFFSLDCPWLA